MSEAGWALESKSSIDTAGMQDADWEIQMAESSIKSARNLVMPEKLLGVLESQFELLQSFAIPKGNMALPAFSVVATR